LKNLKHDRPHLRFIDNLRRELGADAQDFKRIPTDYTWPDFLRPIAAEKESLGILFSLLETLHGWFEEDVVSFSDPPEHVRRSAAIFAKARVQHQYDNGYNVEQWVADLRKDHREHVKSWGNALAEFIDLSCQ